MMLQFLRRKGTSEQVQKLKAEAHEHNRKAIQQSAKRTKLFIDQADKTAQRVYDVAEKISFATGRNHV
jgi:hypothetical protein